VIDGVRVFTDQACQFLDKTTNLCTVYEKRFQMGVGCLSAKEAAKIRALPNDCPFVAHIPNYEGPKDWREVLGPSNS